MYSIWLLAWVVGRGGYTQTRTWTQAILKYTFAFIQQLIITPTAAHNAVKFYLMLAN